MNARSEVASILKGVGAVVITLAMRRWYFVFTPTIIGIILEFFAGWWGPYIFFGLIGSVVAFLGCLLYELFRENAD